MCIIELTTHRNPDEVYVTPSVTRRLQPGERVDTPDLHGPKYVVQRLTDRSYWMIANAFTTTAFVGDAGVLLIDAPSSLNPDDLFEALRAFTDLPVTTLVYSHHHVDHNGGSYRLKAALAEQGLELRVIGSEKLAREVKRYQDPIVAPTETVPTSRETFRFETWDFKLVTPVETAHSGADSYIITPDGVIKYVDFNYPGRLPLAFISSSQSITGWIEFLRHAAGEDWQFADLGHANVGYKKDIDLTFEYLNDVYNAFFTAIAPMWERGEFFRAGYIISSPEDTAGIFWHNFVDTATDKMVDVVKEKWKDVQHAEVLRSHNYKVFEDAFLHYNAIDNPSVRPIFTPISPSERNAA